MTVGLSTDDIYLFNEGRHFRLYEHLGAHAGAGGVTFAVWAPSAAAVSVVGDRNGWHVGADPLATAGELRHLDRARCPVGE